MASMKLMIVVVVVCLASVTLFALAKNTAACQNCRNIVRGWNDNRKYIEHQMDMACAKVDDRAARLACQEGIQASKDALEANPLSKPGYCNNVC